jgi:hypothetical protein
MATPTMSSAVPIATTLHISSLHLRVSSEVENLGSLELWPLAACPSDPEGRLAESLPGRGRASSASTTIVISPPGFLPLHPSAAQGLTQGAVQ